MDCPVVDVISPTTCTCELEKDYMAISMFGNGTMHFDLGRGDLLLKPAFVPSFAVLARQSTKGTLFCKQSKHKHVTPDLILPSLANQFQSTFEITEIAHLGPDLKDLLPIDVQVNVVKNKLQQASVALDSTEKLLAESQHHTSTTLQHLKSHVDNAVQTVETKMTGIYWDIILKIFLPILLPVVALLTIFLFFQEKLKELCKKKASIPKSDSDDFGPIHMLSKRDESILQ